MNDLDALRTHPYHHSAHFNRNIGEYVVFPQLYCVQKDLSLIKSDAVKENIRKYSDILIFLSLSSYTNLDTDSFSCEQ